MSAEQPQHDHALPTLSDEAAVESHRFLETVLLIFETRYGSQIRRYDDDRSQHNLVRSYPPTSCDDDPLF
jgi:hypothetical protein